MSDFVSGEMSGSDVEAILAGIKTIRGKMSFLKALSADEKNGMVKLGDKSRAFVEKSYDLAKNYGGDFLPAKFDVKEMGKDVELFKALSTVLLALNKLQEEVEDTLFCAGTDAYSSALAVYQYARNSKLGSSGLDGAVDELGKRFMRRAKSKDEPAT